MLKNNNERCIELDESSEDATTNNNKNNVANMSDTTKTTIIHTKIAPSIHLTPLSTLISTPPALLSPPVLLVVDDDDDDDDDDDEPCELAMESSETFSSESIINSASEADAAVSGTSTCVAKALKDEAIMTINQQQHKQLMKVAGPQQQQQQQQQPQQQPQQQRQLTLQEKKRLRQQNPVEKTFPHISIQHQKLRILLASPIGITLQQQLINVVNAYIAGCRNEYEEGTSSPYKCRRLAHSMTRTMDLMQELCASFEDTTEYIHRMIELVAIYLSCELIYAQEFKEHKPLIANRILHNIYKYVKGSNKDETLKYILRVFAHMSRMYREREVMTKIFQTLIPQEQVILQRELPDNLYIQYIIIFFHWKQLEQNHEEQMRVIEFANKFMRPAKTLCTNSNYAYHLPKYTCTQMATKIILHDLKFFHDLRNASIYAHRLPLGTEVIDISNEEHPKSFNFAELVQNAEVQPKFRPMVKLENQIVIATIDLTLEDNRQDDLEWLQELQRNVNKLEPAPNTLYTLAGRGSISPIDNLATRCEVIVIDSDTEGEEDHDDLEEPENLLLEEPEQLSDNFLDFEEPGQDDNSLEEENAITVNTNKNTDHIKPTTEEVNNDASSMSFSQQPTQVFPTKLNIISVRSIAATQTENNYNDCSVVDCKSKVIPELLPAKPNITEIRSFAATQTDNSYIESVLEKSADAVAQLLPSKPTITEVRSIAKTQNNNNCTTLATSTELEATQINPQISKSLNVNLFTESSKLAVSSMRSEICSTRIDDGFLCRRDSLHLSPSPIRSSRTSNENNDTNVLPDINTNDKNVGDDDDNGDYDEDNNDDDDDDDDDGDDEDDENELCFFGNTPNSRTGAKMAVDALNSSSKVIYSVAASTCPPLQNTDFISDDDSPNIKQQSVLCNSVNKRIVKFSNKPLERTCGNPINYPIKPAIKNTNSTYNNQITPINTALSRFDSASPASSTTSLPRPFQKEHLSAFREHYIDAEKRQVLHRQCLPYHLQNIKKGRTNIAASYSSSASSTGGSPYAPTNMASKEMWLVANASSMYDHCSNYYQSIDQKLKKKCRVVVERNYELDRRTVQMVNKLLQMQREKLQQARQELTRQRVLEAKMLEEKMLKEQITELKRQQKQKKAMRRRNENPKRKENKSAMRLQKANEQQTGKMQQHTLTIDGRSNMHVDTIQRSQLGCGIGYFSDSDVSVHSDHQLAISCANNKPKDMPHEKIKEAKENEEELERNLLRTPTPERILNASITPKSETKPVKVRIKRIWEKNRIANEMRALAKEEAQKQELESTNQLAETNLEVERIRNLVLEAKNKRRSQLLDKDVFYDDSDGDEHEQNVEIVLEESIRTPAKIESKPKLSAKERSNMQALERIEMKELATPSFVETAAAASGLAMLANTAATAAIAETREPTTLLADITPSTSAAATAVTQKEVGPSQQKLEENDECIPPSQKLPNCCRISELAAAAGAVINHALGNQSNITLINFEATPTVPAYLFNGESRDVPTPTPPQQMLPAAHAAAPSQDLPITETAPTSASIDSTHVPGERGATRHGANANALPAATANTTPSTSDHEVSSTQETLCEALQLRSTNHSNALMLQTSSPNGNLSARRMSFSSTSTTLSAALVGAAVQNNQVDTTHHLPESTTPSCNSSRPMRRRTRKLSTYDEMFTAAGKEQNKQRHQPVHKRRKTICADASFLVLGTEGHASSPSTTTLTVDKSGTRKRGRPPKTSTTTSKRKGKRSGSNSTPPQLSKLADDANDAGAIKCSSPGVSSKLIEKQIKHTYSTNNIVKNVFVPPEIEEYLENENDSKSSTSPPTAAQNVRNNALTSFPSSYSAATLNPKAGTSSSSTKPITSATKEKKPIIKTVKGAKMKMLKNKQQEEMKASNSLAGVQQQHEKPLKANKNAASGRSRR